MTRTILILLCAVPLAAQVRTPGDFTARVYPVLEAAQCRLCHARDGVASGTRLRFPEPDASPAAIQSFGLSLAVLVNRTKPAESIILAKPVNRIQHTGGERIKPGSGEEKLLREWVEYLAATPAAVLVSKAEAAAKANPMLRRLTHSQYNNTVRDLLSDYSRPANRFPPEDFVDGFKNQTRHQSMSPLQIEAYSTAAERLTSNAFRTGDNNGLIPCNTNDARCRDQFIRGFGLKAFRRPLRDNEVERYAAAFDAQGARAVVEAMLQSAKFLYHAEAGPDGRAKDFAVASRLSYLLWDTMPDDALFAAAARGELQSAANREKAARRMLDDPRAMEALNEFFQQWLRFDRVLSASKERRRFPEFSPELAGAMVEETQRLLHHLVWNNGNFMELFSASYGFLNADLATLYGLPAPAAQFALMRFPPTSKREGILGHGAFLASNAGPTETSITARGIFVREQFLCQHVPPPPPNVNTNLAEPTEAKPLTRRQRLSEHVENPLCSSCHRLMDPIGVGLEAFDAIGKWREKETVFIEVPEGTRTRFKTVELPLETEGDIAGLANSSFSGAKQLGRILSQSRVCQECIVRQVFRYAYGRQETSADEPSIQELFARFRDSGFRFKELLIGIIRSPEFMRGLEEHRGSDSRGEKR
ncbi:MAG: DUF1592 domain-containing protein [Acidobacteria bacterium]|nr:DUF1592 domain-containing protein [Acidobacteriota bacterium]